MKKMKLFSFLLVMCMIFSLWGCAGGQDDDIQADTVEKEAEEETNVPQLDKVKMICELAALECRYHNVAKSTKEAGTGVLHFGEKERTFWIEYTGIAEISFQIEDVKMEQDGTNIIITLPEPQVTCKVDSASWTQDSYVISDDQWIQKNPITADDQTQAIHDAQAAMEDDIRNNSALLNTAELQAKSLIENYILQIGDATGITYSISWKEDAQ